MRWETFNDALQTKMEKHDYLRDKLSSISASTIEDLFPGRNKRWLSSLMNKWAANGKKNQYTLKALQIYYLLIEEDIRTILGIPAETNHSSLCHYLLWEDLEQILHNILANPTGFLQRDYYKLPIQLPVVFAPIECLLVTLSIALHKTNSKVISFQFMSFNLKEIIGVQYSSEKIEYKVFGEKEVTSHTEKALSILKSYYDDVTDYFNVHSNETIPNSAPFDDIYEYLRILYDNKVPEINGQLLDFCTPNISDTDASDARLDELMKIANEKADAENNVFLFEFE